MSAGWFYDLLWMRGKVRETIMNECKQDFIRVPRGEWEARMSLLRTKRQWHFGPKQVGGFPKRESVDHMVQRMRLGVVSANE